MIRTLHYYILFLFLLSPLVTIAQYEGKSLEELSSRSSVFEKVKSLGDECWRLREVNSDSAVIVGQKALRLAVKYNIKKELPRLYSYISVIELHYLYNIKKSIPYLHNALKYSLQQKDSIQLAYSYNNLGDLYFFSGNLHLSAKFTEYSLQLFKELNNSPGIAYAYVNMGLLNREKGNYNLAFDYFEKAISLWKELGSDLVMGSVILEVAKTYETKGDVENAMIHYKDAYSKCKGSERVRFGAFCLNGMANIFSLRGEYDTAFDYYKRALKINKLSNHYYGLMDDYIGLASVYAHKNKRIEAEQSLDAALIIAKKLGQNSKILKAYKAFTEIYKILGDYPKAIESYDNFSKQSDSILSIQQIEIMNEMQNRFSIRQTLVETEQELESHIFQEIYLIIIITLMLLIAIVLYWRYNSHRKLNIELAEINQTKNKLFSVISHDLKNPFNSLIGFSNLLLDEVNEGEYKNVKEYTNYINQASTQGFKLLTKLLDWSRSQTGSIVYNPSTITIEGLFGELNEFFGSVMEKHLVKIQFNSLVDEELKADFDILRTILVNLISNAIKYTNEDGLIKVDVRRIKANVRISVIDNGIGMSQDVLDSLFDNTKTTISRRGLRNEQGTGLGLNICSELIRIQKGTIHVKSELGKGSTFEIEFPFI